jgi:hypothetical protein
MDELDFIFQIGLSTDSVTLLIFTKNSQDWVAIVIFTNSDNALVCSIIRSLHYYF